LTIVLTIVGVVITLGSLAFGGYFQRNAARRAAQVFARDLALARGFAVRSQEPVVIRFYESDRWYVVRAASSTSEMTTRRFGINADIDLSEIDLAMDGDSLVVSSRGTLDLSGLDGALGSASFSSGATTFTVSFNGMGASRIDQN
jgi:Tfp pilus assembly protein FimT